MFVQAAVWLVEKRFPSASLRYSVIVTVVFDQSCLGQRNNVGETFINCSPTLRLRSTYIARRSKAPYAGSRLLAIVRIGAVH